MNFLSSILILTISFSSFSAFAGAREKKFATADLVEKFSKNVTLTDMVDIEKFLGEGADPNATDKYGNPIVFSALEPEELPALQLLAKYKANFNVRNKAGRTPLIALAYSAAKDPKYLPTWKFLLTQKIDVDAVDNYNGTAIQFLTSNIKGDRSLEPLELLLKAGANPNVQGRADAVTYTPLMAAAKMGRDPVINLLVKYKADVNLKTARGTTALDMARNSRHTSTVNLLISLGGTEGEEAQRAPAEINR